MRDAAGSCAVYQPPRGLGVRTTTPASSNLRELMHHVKNDQQWQHDHDENHGPRKQKDFMLAPFLFFGLLIHIIRQVRPERLRVFRLPNAYCEHSRTVHSQFCQLLEGGHRGAAKVFQTELVWLQT